MLNAETLACLSTLTYRSDAKRQVCILPLGTIYWDDELPEIGKFAAFREPDRNEVLRAFAIRLRLWDHQSLADDDREFWDRLRSAAPQWAIFRRLELSEEDQRAREEAERDCEREFEEILTRAEEVTVGEEKHGMRSFSFTFPLDKDHSDMSDQFNKTFWWERWFLRLKRFTKRRPH